MTRHCLVTSLFIVDNNYPPNEFINDSGFPDSFNIELFKAIAEEMCTKLNPSKS